MDESNVLPWVEIERTIEWVDTDATGHIHNTVANRLFEMAEAEYLSQRGLRQLVQATPRVKITFEFRKRLSFGDRIWVRVWIASLGRSSLTWKVRVETQDREVAIEGEVVVVHVEGEFSKPWDEDLRQIMTSEPDFSARV
jgi:acyl-CoA thioester hydrolase